MTKQRIILLSVVCFSLTVFTVQVVSWASSSNRTRIPPFGPDPRYLQSLPKEERGKAMIEWYAQRRQQERESSKEYINLMGRQAWKRLLRVAEQQWKIIGPKYEAHLALDREARIRALGRKGRNEQAYNWNRPSDSSFHPMEGKTRDQMSEGYRIVEELIDLLEDEKSTDEQIRKKIDALHQARQKARETLPQAKKELAEVLTTPRQEAIFLIRGCID